MVCAASFCLVMKPAAAATDEAGCFVSSLGTTVLPLDNVTCLCTSLTTLLLFVFCSHIKCATGWRWWPVVCAAAFYRLVLLMLFQ